MAKYEEFNALERIVQKYVKHFQDDYYKYDLYELSSKERSDAFYGLFVQMVQIS